ncbi:hypothetical protein TWF694_002400 [Orbilia ellipsospora]|uniref:Uncharacterized protein n=1 Tax=Orbilia ellipsospora TaxID=2528407 RepID=A0AAV9X1U9_9PEZI
MFGLALRRRVRRKLEAATIFAIIPIHVVAAPTRIILRRGGGYRGEEEEEEEEEEEVEEEREVIDPYDRQMMNAAAADDNSTGTDADGPTYSSHDLGFEFTSVDLGLVKSSPTVAASQSVKTAAASSQSAVGSGPIFGSVKPLPPPRASSPAASSSVVPSSSRTPQPTGGPAFGAAPTSQGPPSPSSKINTISVPSSVPSSSPSFDAPPPPPATALPDLDADASPTSQPNILPITTGQVGESQHHVRMEIGIAGGVIGAFLIISIIIFFWMKKRRSGKGSSSGGSNEGTEMRGPIEPRGPAQYESRTTADDWGVVQVPDPVVLDNDAVKRLSEALTEEDIERFASIQRKYTITRDVDIPVKRPPLATRRTSLSSYVTMTVAGNGLPNISNSGFDDSFLESIEKGDPFADPFSPSAFSIPPAPLPLKFPVKPLQPQSRIRAMHKYNASDETLELTDPRISPGGRLHITNRSRQDSVPSLPPSPPRKNKMRNLTNTPASLEFRPPQYPWMDQDPASPVDSEGPARHRGVKSWVQHEADIRERYATVDEVTSPMYAKSEMDLYNRFSISSGMDTRRTEYEYY